MPRGYRADGSPAGPPRLIAPSEAIRVNGRLRSLRTCPGCGHSRLVRCYDGSDLCKSCSARERGRSSIKHGYAKHPLYRVWLAMMKRCGHLRGKPEGAKEYRFYRDRRITVCDEWQKDRVAFIKWALANGWKPGLQIDREKNELGYEPGNCRLVTSVINVRNSRACKLTTESVLDIKRRLANGEHRSSIAATYSVDTTTIRGIEKGKSWKDVKT
jgi:hypothetical protein